MKLKRIVCLMLVILLAFNVLSLSVFADELAVKDSEVTLLADGTPQEGPPANAQELLPIYTDGFNSCYVNAWGGISVTEDSTFYKVGTKSLKIGAASTLKQGYITFTNNDRLSRNRSDVLEAIADGDAYVGMWFYAEPSLDWVEVIFNKNISVDRTKLGRWQFILTPITADIQNAFIKIQSPVPYWLDDIKLYYIPPSDTTVVVTAKKYYNQYGENVDDQNAYIGAPIDLEFNYPMDPDSLSNIKMIKTVDSKPIDITASLPDRNRVRITPVINLELDTSYTIKLGGVKNKYGGVLDNYDITFKTAPAPLRLDNITVSMGSGNVTGATLNASLVNAKNSNQNVLVIFTAQKDGETIAAKAKMINAIKGMSTNVNISIEFDSTDSSTVKTNVYAWDEEMMPISIMLKKPDDTFTVGTSSLIGKNFVVTGSFTTGIAGRYVTSAIVSGKKDTFSYDDVVSVCETTTDLQGKFVISEVLRDNLPSGDYTIFVWGEGDSQFVKRTYYYSNISERNELVEKLKSDNPDTVAGALSDSRNYNTLSSLGIYIDEYYKLTTSKELVSSYVASLKPTEKETQEQVCSQINSMIALAVLNEDTDKPIEILLKYANELKIPENILSVINDILENDGYDKLNILINGKTYNNVTTFNDSLKTDVLIAAVNAIKNNNHIKLRALLKDYKDGYGFDSESLFASNGINDYNAMLILQSLIGNNYNSLDNIKADFLKGISKYKRQAASNSGSGPRPSDSKNSTYSGSGTVADAVSSIKYEQQSKATAKGSFVDLEGHWAKEAVEYLYNKGIVNGKSKNVFNPEDNVTREEFVKMVISGLGLVDESATTDFIDVNSQAWYYPYVASAKKAGIIRGYEDNSFGVGQYITREEVAAIIYRALMISGQSLRETVAAKSFADSDKISDFAKEAVTKLQTEGVINGVSDSEFAPASFATRAQVAKIIYNIITKLN